MPTDTKLKKEIELNILKYHLNPHFLYNYLNNLYSLSLSKSDKTPEMILLFSEVIRYINLSPTKPYVLLKEEIKIIKKLITLFKVKFSKAVDITIDIDNPKTAYEIEPMLLLPLVYNALIFSNVREDEGFILINITNTENKFSFNIQFSHSKEPEQVSFDFDSTLIFENIKKRLFLKYKNKANIYHEEQEYLSEFTIIITK
jgi:LytS/YehU family sensor histidine kinase